VAKRTGVFYAYPARPAALGETINNAITDLRQRPEISGAEVRFYPWPDLHVGGKKLLAEITAAITRHDIFAADLTYANANVAFELGFSIAQFKRLWISLDVSIADAANRFKRLYAGILGIGYGAYENHDMLAEAFLSDRPWRSIHEHVLGDTYRRQAPRSELPTLLYAKPQIPTNAAIRVSEYLETTMFADALIVDDPRENASPTLEWYAEQIHACDAVLVHLLSDEHENSAVHNVRASFVAGLAHGMRKPTLMLAHSPFECPTDYQTLLVAHDTAEQCENKVKSWIESLDIPRRRARRADEGTRRAAAMLEVRNLSLGDPVAENENLKLDDYFVETNAFFDSIESQSTILVGRRGTGKSATLIALQAAFGRDKRNHVCVIKPVGYEVDGLVKLLREAWPNAERGYLIESLWKFLIYTELASSVCAAISSRPVHYERSQDESNLVDYVERHSDVLLAPFSQRLAKAVGSLAGTGQLTQTAVQRDRISEFLHTTHLQALRRLLGSALRAHSKVAILIDNLDEPWVAGSDTDILSTLILGLLRESQLLSDDFHHRDRGQESVNVSLTIFLRSDIFSYIHPLASEQDKWPIRRMTWHDSELLLRVIDERLLSSAPPRFTAADIWETLMPAEVVGLPVKEFIVRNTLARPRDVIYLAKEAVAIAVNRAHARVTEDDFLLARERYSQFVFRSVLAEDDPRLNKMESILYEFAGAGRIVSMSDVFSRFDRAGVTTEERSFYVNLLCDVNFIGIQTASGFRFSANEDERQTLIEVARRLRVERQWADDSFEVNPAFHHVLQIA
jgi:hypothetical protein